MGVYVGRVEIVVPSYVFEDCNEYHYYFLPQVSGGGGPGGR